MRRTQCTSQISQLILALHDYEASHEHYPSGTIDKQGPIKNLPVGNHISWIASILPFIEEGVLYNKLDTSLGAYNYKNDRVRQVTIPLLICPSCNLNSNVTYRFSNRSYVNGGGYYHVSVLRAFQRSVSEDHDVFAYHNYVFGHGAASHVGGGEHTFQDQGRIRQAPYLSGTFSVSGTPRPRWQSHASVQHSTNWLTGGGPASSRSVRARQRVPGQPHVRRAFRRRRVGAQRRADPGAAAVLVRGDRRHAVAAAALVRADVRGLDAVERRGSVPAGFPGPLGIGYSVLEADP